ncbi:MAG TPA: hypothetical protein VIL16_27775 [Trebonia sp.]
MRAAGRLISLELRHNAMPLMLPLIAALFWLTTYRKVMAMPPLWNVRAASLQMNSVIVFVAPLAGAAAWMGSRESRRRVTDTVSITPRARWARLLPTWAATTIWALVAYLGCVAVLYGATARQASWGGPLWWPVAVAAASLPAFTALGFAAGVFAPSRFTAPITAIAAFFILVVSTELIIGSHSYWQITPVVAYAWDLGADPGVATFYPFLPDLPIAQLMFLGGFTVTLLGALALTSEGARALRIAAVGLTVAGLAVAVTAVMLAGTGTMDAHGMIRIPALHDAADDQPVRFTPVCSRTAIPVCLNPAYSSYLAATAATLEPVLEQIAGLPGAPVRILQEAAAYKQDTCQGPGSRVRSGTCSPNGVEINPGSPMSGGSPLVYRLLLPAQLPGPALTTAQMASQTRGDGWDMVRNFIGDGPGASPAQDAVTAAIIMAGKQPGATATFIQNGQDGTDAGRAPGLTTGTPANAAAKRFAALPASARHAWLAGHLAALRAGQITVAQVP